MALTISIDGNPKSANILFDADDPVYWYLYPYFEDAWRETGEMVDLYGYAEFFAEQLLELFLILDRAKSDANARTEEWTVTIGTRGHDQSPIEVRVTKSAVVDCITALQELLNDAFNSRQVVICFGD